MAAGRCGLGWQRVRNDDDLMSSSGVAKGAWKGDPWDGIQRGGARGRSRHPFIGLGMANRAVGEEGERRPMVELFNDFGTGSQNDGAPLV
jgi:hypothetical protein